MRRISLILLMAASTVAASAQTASKPAPHAATAARPATARPATTGFKLPAGVPPVKGPMITAFSLRYQDIKIGTGADAEPKKMYKVHYTGWLATDGRKFDSSYDHPGQPVLDKDGNIVKDADGKVKIGDPQPISFPQGLGRVIPGFDQGFLGMKIGGKRRLFIPWQLAYGALGRPGPDPAHPGIPAKADLIFDIELMDQSEIAMPANHPVMGGSRPMPGGATQQPTVPAQPATSAQPATTPQPTPPAGPK